MNFTESQTDGILIFLQDHRMPESPSTSSTISAVEEDPNDPEWTVVNDRDVKEDLEYRNRNKR